MEPKIDSWSPHRESAEMNLTGIPEDTGSIPSLSGLRIWRCHELWCRLQMQLGSRIAVAVVWAGSYSSD